MHGRLIKKKESGQKKKKKKKKTENEERQARLGRVRTRPYETSGGNRRRASAGAGRKEGCPAVAARRGVASRDEKGRRGGEGRAATAAAAEKVEVIIPLEQWPHDLAYASRSMSHGH